MPSNTETAKLFAVEVHFSLKVRSMDAISLPLNIPAHVKNKDMLSVLFICLALFSLRALSPYSISHSFFLLPYIMLDCISLCTTQFSPQFRVTKTEMSTSIISSII